MADTNTQINRPHHFKECATCTSVNEVVRLIKSRLEEKESGLEIFEIDISLDCSRLEPNMNTVWASGIGESTDIVMGSKVEAGPIPIHCPGWEAVTKRE